MEEKSLDSLPYPNLELVQGVAAGIDTQGKVGVVCAPVVEAVTGGGLYHLLWYSGGGDYGRRPVGQNGKAWHCDMSWTPVWVSQTGCGCLPLSWRLNQASWSAEAAAGGPGAPNL